MLLLYVWLDTGSGVGGHAINVVSTVESLSLHYSGDRVEILLSARTLISPREEPITATRQTNDTRAASLNRRPLLEAVTQRTSCCEIGNRWLSFCQIRI